MNLIKTEIFKKSTSWRAPTEEEINSTVFEALWQAMREWDIGISDIYSGYTGTMGNHVCMILDALKSENLLRVARELETKRLNLKDW